LSPRVLPQELQLYIALGAADVIAGCWLQGKMPFEKTIVVDGRGHLLGRLASIVAKELLLGWVDRLWRAAS